MQARTGTEKRSAAPARQQAACEPSTGSQGEPSIRRTERAVHHADSSPTPERPVVLVLQGSQLGQVFPLNASKVIVGRDVTADLQLSDGTVSRRHARLVVMPDGGFVEDLSSRNGTFVNGRRVRERLPMRAGDYVRFGGNTVVKFCLMRELEQQALATLLDLTLRDPLTRLHNRRYFDERLHSELSFARRQGQSLALLMADIDHFKRVNDEHGHLTGDRVLKVVSKLLRDLVRPEDVVARYGGEEFVILTRHVSPHEARALAERLRGEVQDLVIAGPEHPLQVRISIGVVTMDASDACAHASTLVAAADEALYRAKAAGRNCVSIAHLRSDIGREA